MTIAEAGLGEDFRPMAERLKQGELPDCAQRALSQPEVVVIEDPSSDCVDCPLSKKYNGWGAMTVRLEYRGKVYGFISLSIPKNLIKDEEEHSLLKEVAGDIAFALHNIELEEALWESEKRLRTVVSNAPVVLFMIDREGVFTLSEGKGLDALGLKPGEVVGQSVFDVYRDVPQILESIRRALAGEAFTSTVEVEDLVFETRYSPLRDESGEVVGVIGIATDITERKRAERKLAAIYVLGGKLVLSQDETEIAQAVVDTAREVLGLEDCGLFLVDGRGEWLVMAAHTLGDKPPGPKRFPLDSKRGIMVAVARSGETIYLPDVSQDPRFWGGTRPTRSELCVPLKAGERILGVLNVESTELDAFSAEDRQLLEALANAAAVALENAQLYEAVRHELAERKKAEEEVRKLSQYLDSIIDNANVWLDVLDEKANVVIWNKAAEEISGFKREEVVGHGKIWEWLYPDEEYRNEVFERAIAIIEKGETEEDFETTIRRKDGQIRIISWNSRNLVDEKGNPIGSIALGRDVTERKRAEEALKQSYQRLEKLLDQVVNVLASAVEIRDPYTAGHQRGVTELACAIAKEMGLSKEQIKGIRMAGLIHDIGKINVPAEILSKPGPLNEIEFDLIKIHPQVGHEVLKTIEFPWPVAKIVLQHHERIDGSGYPQGLSGGEIMLEARILGVADVVEAMASHRPYRPAHSIDEALEEIKQNRGVLYDIAVVDACLRVFEKGFKFESKTHLA
jgi:PAS domain S-box-containing protein/putative nucleotidyltransferase with HDIG domain